jgi:hypothetical protein
LTNVFGKSCINVFISFFLFLKLVAQSFTPAQLQQLAQRQKLLQQQQLQQQQQQQNSGQQIQQQPQTAVIKTGQLTTQNRPQQVLATATSNATLQGK